MKQFVRHVDENGNPYVTTELSGYMITRLPLLNKSSGFSADERRELGLTGLIAPHISTLEQQVERAYTNYKRFMTGLDKHVYLRVLQDRNETLFYALLEQYLEEMLPML